MAGDPAMDRIPGVDPGLDSRIAVLGGAIAKHRAAKSGLPECPCWGNTPRLVDSDLYAAADAVQSIVTATGRWAALEGAVRKHRDDMAMTPECTCWNTPSAKADAELYAALDTRG